MAWLLKNLSLRRCKGIRPLVVILVLRERRSDGAAESGHTLCASSTNRSLSASPQKIPMDRHACFHRRMTSRTLSREFAMSWRAKLANKMDYRQPLLLISACGVIPDRTEDGRECR